MDIAELLNNLEKINYQELYKMETDIFYPWIVCLMKSGFHFKRI